MRHALLRILCSAAALAPAAIGAQAPPAVPELTAPERAALFRAAADSFFAGFETWPRAEPILVADSATALALAPLAGPLGLRLRVEPARLSCGAAPRGERSGRSGRSGMKAGLAIHRLRGDEAVVRFTFACISSRPDARGALGGSLMFLGMRRAGSGWVATGRATRGMM